MFIVPCLGRREGILGPANTYSYSSVRGSWDKLREPGTGFSRSFPFSTGMASICRAVWGPMPYKPFRAFSGKIEFISDMDRRHAVFLGLLCHRRTLPHPDPPSFNPLRCFPRGGAHPLVNPRSASATHPRQGRAQGMVQSSQSCRRITAGKQGSSKSKLPEDPFPP